MRVGVPQVPEVASAGVNAEELARERHQRLEQDRQHVEQRLRGLVERTERLATLEARIGEYDHEAYRNARGLLEFEDEIARLASAAWEKQEEYERATREESVAEKHLRDCEQRWSATAPARAHLEWAARTETYLSGLAQQARDRAAELADLETRARAGVLAVTSWARGRALAPRARRRTDSARELLGAEQRRLVPLIAEQRRLAQPLDEAQLQRLSSDLARAKAHLADARDAVQRTEAAVDPARRDLAQAEAGPRASPEHRTLVDWADAAGHPEAYEEARNLGCRSTPSAIWCSSSNSSTRTSCAR